MADIDAPLSWRMQQDGYLMQIDQLRTENAKLRDLMYERAHRHAIQHMTEDELRIVATNVLDENTELRRLVRDMHKALFSLNLDHCQACPREDACVFIHKSFDCDECAFERDMHKLGIEVDG